MVAENTKGSTQGAARNNPKSGQAVCLFEETMVNAAHK